MTILALNNGSPYSPEHNELDRRMMQMAKEVESEMASDIAAAKRVSIYDETSELKIFGAWVIGKLAELQLRNEHRAKVEARQSVQGSTSYEVVLDVLIDAPTKVINLTRKVQLAFVPRPGDTIVTEDKNYDSTLVVTRVTVDITNSEIVVFLEDEAIENEGQDDFDEDAEIEMVLGSYPGFTVVTEPKVE